MLEQTDWTALPVTIGHWTHPEGLTGCTVLLPQIPAWVSGEVRGAAPGTRETDLLEPGGLVGQAHAIVLAGGSAFGLAAADGVMWWLREHNIGYGIGTGLPPVPIVPAAVIFDLGAAAGVAPDAAAGRAACAAATVPSPTWIGGRVGVGASARVGKAGNMEHASLAGLGSAVLRAGGITVGALIAVNALGEVRDPASGRILAGIRNAAGGFTPTLDLLTEYAAVVGRPNTVIGVVVTNAPLDPAALRVVARMGNAGLARVITPAHTMYDGDTLFTLAVPPDPAPPARPSPALVTLTGSLAAEAVAQAIVNAVRQT
jgi:L-aminopeptidase/D-esterase-like protein